MVHGRTGRLLGRHVMRRAEDDASGRDLRRRRELGAAAHGPRKRFGETEIQDLDDAIFGDHHVLGLEVTVDDAGSVGLLEPSDRLNGDAQCALHGNRPVVENLPKRSSRDVLHRDAVSNQSRILVKSFSVWEARI